MIFPKGRFKQHINLNNRSVYSKNGNSLMTNHSCLLGVSELQITELQIS